MKELVMVAQERASSGLVLRLKEGLARGGVDVHLADCRARFRHKWWPALKCFHPHRTTWLRKRWETGLFSEEAWHRNTAINGHLLKQARWEGLPLLQVGGNYFPHPCYRQIDYHLFITYPMILCYRDKIKPWVPPPRDRQVFLDLERELYSHARHVFVNAQYVRHCLEKDYGLEPGRITVTGLGVHDDYLKAPPLRIPVEFKRKLLFVGRDFGYKGGNDLLDAFALVRERIPGLLLNIVGPAPQEIRATEGVHVRGPVHERRDLLHLYRDADLFVMPSLCDSYGFVFLEAMSQGLPCIGTNLNAMPEIIRHGETGYIVPLRDPESIASSILEYYRDPTNRSRMGLAARDAVAARYTWGRVAGCIVAEIDRSGAV